MRNNGAHLNDFEIRSFDSFESAEFIVVPTWIGRATDVPVGTVVCEDHSVLL